MPSVGFDVTLPIEEWNLVVVLLEYGAHAIRQQGDALLVTGISNGIQTAQASTAVELAAKIRNRIGNSESTGLAAELRAKATAFNPPRALQSHA